MLRSTLVVFLFFIVETTRANIETAGSLNRKCRDLLTCAIKQNCVQVDWLSERFENASISKQLYNDLDQGIDYACVFTSGCMEECDRCPLCRSAKNQLVDVLSGTKRESGGECSVLVNCASDCVVGANVTQINRCFRFECAFHCFDGSCPKCAAFTTRIFNQICATTNLRNKVQSFEGQCYQLFKSIVFAKFESEFKRTGLTPSIGPKSGPVVIVR